MTVTNATRIRNRDVIVRTLRYVAPDSDPRALLPSAQRESNFVHKIDATHPADVEGAKKAFERNKDGLFKNNPWVAVPSLWATSRGMFQFMPANHLHRFDPNADPRVLWHPVVNTIVAARLFNKHVQAGAKNLCDVRSGWAGGTKYWEKDPKYAERCKSLKNRLVSMGFPESLATVPTSYFKLDAFGTGPQKWDRDLVAHISRQMGLSDMVPAASIPENWTKPVEVPGEPPVLPDPKKDTPTQPTKPNEPTKPASGIGNIAQIAVGGLFTYLLVEQFRGKKRRG